MANRNKNSMMRKDALGGFTIIEVVLVLAIAGLIFMMVFIALPQLQRAQRDTQRRSQISSFQSAVTQFQANNNGKIPGQNLAAGASESCTGANAFATTGASTTTNQACRLIKVYLNSANATVNTFTDPDGTEYDVTITKDIAAANSGAENFNHTIYMVVQAKCGDEQAVAASNPRDYAVLYKLEGSGTHCSDNQ